MRCTGGDRGISLTRARRQLQDLFLRDQGFFTSTRTSRSRPSFRASERGFHRASCRSDSRLVLTPDRTKSLARDLVPAVRRVIGRAAVQCQGRPLRHEKQIVQSAKSRRRKQSHLGLLPNRPEFVAVTSKTDRRLDRHRPLPQRVARIRRNFVFMPAASVRQFQREENFQRPGG